MTPFSAIHALSFFLWLQKLQSSLTYRIQEMNLQIKKLSNFTIYANDTNLKIVDFRNFQVFVKACSYGAICSIQFLSNLVTRAFLL